MLGQLAQVQIPDIAWSAISPELLLFGFGLLILMLDIAAERRLQIAFVVAGVTLAAAGYAAWETGAAAIPGLVGLLALGQFALTATWRGRPRLLGALLAVIGFTAALGATVWLWALSGPAGQVVATDTTLEGMVALDGVALFTRIIVCVAGIVTVPLGYAYAEARRIHRGEYYPLLLFAATGMTLLASSADLIMVFISVEILSLALYVLTAFARRDLNSQEAGIKYFLLGAFSSAILLYGIAIVYGASGTTSIAAAGRALAAVDAPTGMTVAGLALVLVGLAFKAAVVPFHMWTPDVYQGAPTPVTGFMAAATKAVAFAALLRIFVGGFGPLHWTWAPAVWLLAVLTMLIGSLLAIVQDDLKRMLGYSAVAHAGFLLVGIITLTPAGVSATLFYLLVYALLALGSFGVLSLLERRSRKAIAITDLRGLGRRNPVPALLLGFFLLSLAGLPPTAGFWAKFAVFSAAVEAGWVWLVVIGVLASVIAFFFYVRVIAAMFLDDEVVEAGRPLVITPGLTAGLAGATAAVLLLSVTPLVSWLAEAARRAVSLAG